MKIKSNKSRKAFTLSALALATAFVFSCAQQPSDADLRTQSTDDQKEAELANAHTQQQRLHPEKRAKKNGAELMAAQGMHAQMAMDSHWVGIPEPHFDHSHSTEKYQDFDENTVKRVSQSPVSTFSIDVDTGSYSNTRRMLNQGYLPPKDAVRVEEFINYFDYAYDRPDDALHPFSISTDVSVAPWDEQRHLIRIGLQGYEDQISDQGKNLVFLIDVSGSMNQPNKLPLLKRSLIMLSNQLTTDDKVSIVVYAGASGVVLEPTDGNNTAKITAALEQLEAGGSTNGASGIQLAYQMAEQAFIKDGVNRVILATDGDFNVGMVDHDTLIELIEKQREKGIALTTLGFGAGNYNDYLMEQLADAGNGNYAYIDTIKEARKVLVDELSATMQIIAKDVKVQVEFNPNQVAEYRLIGYENRALKNEDFNNDKVDAGDIGAGHTVTALYEITLVDSDSKFNDDLRYADFHKDSVKSKRSNADQNKNNNTGIPNELAHVKLRYKAPHEETSRLIEKAVYSSDISDFAAQSSDFQFTVAVAGFAQLIKGSSYTNGIDYDWVVELANSNKGEDAFGYRSEFVQLARNAAVLRMNNDTGYSNRDVGGR